MPNYHFHSLSPADFEDLSRDLLQAELETRLEAFSPGRDGGIDLRRSTASDGTLIVQCKHYSQSGYSALKSNLKNSELSKIRRLAPERYILCTSVDLTPGRKSELLALLSPFCTQTLDIIGRKDLNNLLGLHQEVETRHHKLWLTSEAVLHRVLHNAAFMQGNFVRESISRRLSLYVETPAFERAKKILEEHNYVILSGIPGVGKTTLAEILVVHLLNSEFDLVVATRSVSEALDLLLSDRKQTVYYDDFLGRSSFSARSWRKTRTEVWSGFSARFAAAPPRS